MTRGIKIQDVTVGTGDQALRGKTVVANVRMFLNHGTELTGTLLGGQKMRIDLRKRECIAGLKYGIEGMRVGGVRSLIISPHLAYGGQRRTGSCPAKCDPSLRGGTTGSSGTRHYEAGRLSAR